MDYKEVTFILRGLSKKVMQSKEGYSQNHN